MSEIIRLNAGNDMNGNPRRVFIEITKGALTGSWDEGYSGSDALPTRKRHKWSGITFYTTAHEYRELINMF